MIIAAPNYGSSWNGFGAIDLTVQRKAKAPMAYRVLVPWLVAAVERMFHTPPTRRIDIYQAAKLALTTVALWAVAQAWGISVMGVTALLMLATIKYDYWSYAPELAGVALAWTGDPLLAVAGGILAGLSKETAPIVPITFWFATGGNLWCIPVALATIMTMILVRLNVGRRPAYTSLWKLPTNLKKYFARDPNTGKLIFFLYQPLFYSDVFISLLITLLVVGAVVAGVPGWPVALAITGAGWTMALADETRVFTPALPFVAAWLLEAL